MLSSDVKKGAMARIALDPMGQELRPAKQTMERAKKAVNLVEEALAEAKAAQRQAAMDLEENFRCQKTEAAYKRALLHVETVEALAAEVVALQAALDKAVEAAQAWDMSKDCESELKKLREALGEDEE